MDDPLGRAVGNALEVKEAINTLRGNGPTDLLELVMIQGGLLLSSSKSLDSEEELNFVDGQAKINEVIQSGKALKKVNMPLYIYLQ